MVVSCNSATEFVRFESRRIISARISPQLGI